MAFHHIFMLHAPDFLGYPDVVRMAQDHADIVQRALQLKKAGKCYRCPFRWERDTSC